VLTTSHRCVINSLTCDTSEQPTDIETAGPGTILSTTSTATDAFSRRLKTRRCSSFLAQLRSSENSSVQSARHSAVNVTARTRHQPKVFGIESKSCRTNRATDTRTGFPVVQGFLGGQQPNRLSSGSPSPVAEPAFARRDRRRPTLGAQLRSTALIGISY
jgi:hypothetical protein